MEVGYDKRIGIPMMWGDIFILNKAVAISSNYHLK
jgi:hypothetical protein